MAGGYALQDSILQAQQNNLYNLQMQNILSNNADEAYKRTPEYLNQQLHNTRTAQQQAFNTSRTGAYNSARENIINQFKDAGLTGQEAPYLQALQKDYDNIGYHPGTDYSYGETPAVGQWDEAAYLAANPDVASSFGFGSADPTYFQSGLDHYNSIGKYENRGGVPVGYGSAPSPSLIQATQDTWDDPTALTTKDYGVGAFINNQRQGWKDTAFGTAKNTATQRLGSMGLDADTAALLSGNLNTALDTTYRTSGLSANDYSTVFNPDAILNSVLDTERGGRRTAYTTQARTAFGGIDPNADFADTADDSYINDIVGRQYSDASSALERARARGALTDTGYSSGLSYLGEQKQTADSTAQTLGGSVLSRNRDTLSGIKSNALTKAGSWDFGDQFDPNSFLTDYSSKKDALSQGLGGDINSALAGQHWFDVGDVLTKAGYAQGAQNTAPLTGGFSTPAAMAAAGERDKNKSAARGLGGTGVF